MQWCRYLYYAMLLIRQHHRQSHLDVQALMLEGQRHSFCTSTPLSYAMADACATILEDMALKPQAEAPAAIRT